RVAHLPRERSASLRRLNVMFALDDIEAMWQDILTCLQGEMEKVPGKAYQDVRAADEKWKAQKRTGKTVSGDWKHQEPIDPESIFWPGLSRTGVEDQAIHNLYLMRLYEQVRKRWGERGRLFLEALRDGKTIEEASTDAGVSRQTGSKYIKEIQKLLHP